MAENMNNVNPTNSDKSTDVNLTVEQLSYICKYCGKVNAISAPNCVRCGKRRPRNDYLNAMKRLGQSQTTREEYIAEQTRAEEENRDVRNQQFVRMVETRVEEEKARMQAQQEVRLDQDREEIKRATARDAVLRIIAAETAADTRVAEAEARADAVISDKSREIDDLIAAEREKALNAAAEKLVAERAAVEEAARERVEAGRRANELDAARQIAEAKDEAEQTAARQAVLQVIAAQQAAEDQIRLSREAYQQAATERIIEERVLADKEAAARYAAEKQAIERAAEERIRAEREAVRKILGDREAGYVSAQPVYGQGPVQQVQPIAIVPYLNQNQPVYQYNPERVVYKFIPDQNVTEEQQSSVVMPVANYNETVPAAEKGGKAEKKSKRKEKTPAIPAEKTVRARVCGIFTLLFSVVFVLFAVVTGLLKDGSQGLTEVINMTNIADGTVLFGTNTDIILAFVALVISGINTVFNANITIPELCDNEFYLSANLSDFAGAGVVSVMLVMLTVIAVILIIRGIIRIAGGKGKRSDFVAGLVMIIGSVVSIVCHLLTGILGINEMSFAEAAKAVLVTNYGNIIMLALSVILTIIGGISGGKKRK